MPRHYGEAAGGLQQCPTGAVLLCPSLLAANGGGGAAASL